MDEKVPVLIENMIRWAEEKLGDTQYCGWCLSFIEDALEISSGIEIFGGDSAKASAELYADALKTGLPERGAFVFYDCLCMSDDGPVNWGHCGIGLGDGRVIHAWDRVRTDDYLRIEKLTAVGTNDHPCYIGWVPVERVLGQKPEEEKQMSDLKYIILRDCPELMDRAASWFHEKWGVPKEAYQECMEAYLSGATEYGWYLCLDGERIVGGLGVIENDFHDRKDLAPNVCAVYTEEEYRCRGIAGRLLNLVVEDQRRHGISPLYLVTDHTNFYERYGWEFYCMAQGDGEPAPARMYIHR